MDYILKLFKSTNEDLGSLFEKYWKWLLLASIGGGILVRRKLKERKRISELKEVIVKVQDRMRLQKENLRKSLLVCENGENLLVTKSRQNILDLPIKKLVLKLREGHLRPIDVLQAYQAKALLSTDETNCICLFIDEATDRAMELQSTPINERGALFGLPISIKECFQVKGYDMTAGLTKFVNKPAGEDGPFVKRLKDLGAVPFCLTNVPQTMKTYACSNPIYGETVNPWDAKRSPGGSSGGEACLLAQKGSILGIGSDVGGSLRLPSHFCGTVALKPTTGRIFQGGRRKGAPGLLIGVHSNAGFMSQTVDGILLGMKAIMNDPFEMNRLDHEVAPIPWSESLYNPRRKLRIGWLDDFGGIEMTPSVKRAIKEAVDLFQKGGHHVEHFHLKDFLEVKEMFFNHIFADLGEHNMEYVKDDILDWSMEFNARVSSLPRWFKRSVVYYLAKFQSPLTAPLLLYGLGTSSELQLSLERLKFYKDALLRDMDDQELDVLLTPIFPCPAPYQRDPVKLLPAGTLCYTLNTLNFPAGVLPVTKVTKEDQSNIEHYPFDRKHKHDKVYQIIRHAMKGAEGLPVGVQIIGRPYHEERVLHSMKELETLRNKSNKLFH